MNEVLSKKSIDLIERGGIPYREITSLGIEAHTLPRFAKFANAALDLKTQVSLQCETNGPVNAPKALESFERTALAWSGIHHLRWGPAQVDYRHERMAFGADPANYVARQLSKLILKTDADVLDYKKLEKKSVAIQGLTALELLLFSQQPSADYADYHCALTKSVASNISAMASDMHTEWLAPDGYQSVLLDPNESDLFVRNDREAAMQFFKPWAGGLRFMIDVELKDPMQNELHNARPKHAPYWRAGFSNASILTKLQAFEELYSIIGFADVAKRQKNKLHKEISSSFPSARAYLQKLTLPLGEAVKSRQEREHISKAIRILDELWNLVVYEFAEHFNFTIGFNEFDGD